MGRIEFLQTGFEPLIDPPELGGGRYQELIDYYKIKKEEIWDTGCGKIINIWAAMCDGRITEMRSIVGEGNDMDFFMDVAIENEIQYLRYA